jgi:hypothetical protein
LLDNLEADNGVVHVINAVLVLSINECIRSIVSDNVNLNLYPNPTRDFITIEAAFNGSEEIRIDLFNIVGKRVLSYDLGSRNEMIQRKT